MANDAKTDPRGSENRRRTWGGSAVRTVCLDLEQARKAETRRAVTGPSPFDVAGEAIDRHVAEISAASARDSPQGPGRLLRLYRRTDKSSATSSAV